jgi:mercuric ion transport protein
VSVGIGATGILASTAEVLKALIPYRPAFIGLSIFWLGVAFYLVYRQPRHVCDSEKICVRDLTSSGTRTWLWLMTILSIGLVLAPYWLEMLPQ